MFSGLKTAEAESFEKHLNKYNVIRLNMAEFSSVRDMNDKIGEIEKVLLFDIKRNSAILNYSTVHRLSAL